MTAPPLADLYDLLRSEGFAIGPDDHVRIGRLIARDAAWSLDELRTVVASLVIKDSRERATFDDCWRRWLSEVRGPTPMPITAPETAQPTGRESARSWRLATFALVLLALGGGMWWWLWRDRTAPRVAIDAGITVDVAPFDDAAVDAGVDAAPNIAPVARDASTPSGSVRAPAVAPRDAAMAAADATVVRPVERRTTIVELEPATPPPPLPGLPGWLRLLGVIAGIALASVALLASVVRHRRSRRFLPGPWIYRPVFPAPRKAVLGRVDIEDAAADLTWQTENAGQELDLDRSVERTVRAGGLPSLVFRRPPAAPAYVVLEDVAKGSARWRFLYDELLRGLRREGVTIAHYTFDAVPERCRDEGGRTVTLRDLLEHADALIVIGDGAAAIELDSGRPASWITQLRQVGRRLWINPLPPARWNEGARAIARDTPMEHGVANAIARLHGPIGAPERPRAFPRVIERAPASPTALAALRNYLGEQGMQLLAALAVVGAPTLGAARHLAERLGMTLDEHDWLHLASLPWLDRSTWPDGMRAALQQDLETRAPSILRRAREIRENILVENEPPIGTAAHLAWELEQAVATAERGERRQAWMLAARATQSPLELEARRRLGALGLTDRRARAIGALALLGLAIVTLAADPLAQPTSAVPPRARAVPHIPQPGMRQVLVDDVSVVALDPSRARVTISATAIDLATGLPFEPSRWIVRVGGRDIEVQSAAPDVRPVELTIAAQSTLVSTHEARIRAALATLPAGSRWRVVFFGDIVGPPTTAWTDDDRVALRGSVALREAVDRSLRGAARERPRVLVISDGRDDGFGPSADTLGRRAAERPVRIDTIGVARDETTTRRLAFLGELSRESRGVFRIARNDDELDRAVGAFARSLANERGLVFETPLATLPHALRVVAFDGERAVRSAHVRVPGVDVPPLSTGRARLRIVLQVILLAITSVAVIELALFAWATGRRRIAVVVVMLLLVGAALAITIQRDDRPPDSGLSRGEKIDLRSDGAAIPNE